MERRLGKIIIHASGGTAGKGANTYKLTLPSVWVKKMGINELDREVELFLMVIALPSPDVCPWRSSFPPSVNRDMPW